MEKEGATTRKAKEQKEVIHNAPAEMFEKQDYAEVDKARETYKLWVSLNPDSFKDDLTDLLK